MNWVWMVVGTICVVIAFLYTGGSAVATDDDERPVDLERWDQPPPGEAAETCAAPVPVDNNVFEIDDLSDEMREGERENEADGDIDDGVSQYV